MSRHVRRQPGQDRKENENTNLDVTLHALKVQTASVRIVVAVVAHLQTSVLEKGNVVGPSGSGEIESSVGLESVQIFSCHTQSTSSTQRLNGHILKRGGELVSPFP